VSAEQSTKDRFAAPIVGRETFFLQLLADLHRVRVRVIALVDRDEDRNFRGLGVAQRFERLRHDAVIRGDDEHHDVGDVRAAGAHGAERRVTGRVEERDLLQIVLPLRMREGNRVSTDVLRDAARFAVHDVRFADDVEQGGLAVVHVTHDGDHGRTRLELLGFVFEINLDLLDRGVNLAFALGALFNLEFDAVFGANLDRKFFVNRLIHVGEDAGFHEVGDDLEWLLLQRFRQFADDDRRLDDDDLRIGGQREFRGRGFCRFGGRPDHRGRVVRCCRRSVDRPDHLGRGRAGIGRCRHRAGENWSDRRGGGRPAGGRTPPRSGAFGCGRGVSWMKPTFSPTCGLGGSTGFGGYRSHGQRAAQARGLAQLGQWSSRGGVAFNDSASRLRFQLRAVPARTMTGAGAGASTTTRSGRGLGGLDDFDLLLDGRGFGFGGRGGPGFEPGGNVGRRFEDFLFEIFGGDLVERAGRDFSGGNAQGFRSGKDFFVFQAELLRDFVNAYGHNSSTPTAYGRQNAFIARSTDRQFLCHRHTNRSRKGCRR
jgi:hypothetical protein